jgi:CubicO group peptidase (beta-lactamase class C family)
MRVRAILSMILLLAAAPARAQQAQGPLGDAIRERLTPLREREGLPALGGCVVRLEGVAGVGVVGARALGAPAQVTVSDPWHLGSCTKAMTATLLGRLVEAGELAWDTTLARAFPDLAPGMDPAWREVTLEQLLCHRSGAPEGLERDGLWTTLWTDEERTREQLRRLVVETVTRHPPEAPPGSRFIYSNGGYTIAGAIAERVRGAAWEELLRAELLEPLGMAGAGFGAPGVAGAADAPRGHRSAGGRLVAVEPVAMADNPPTIGPAGTVHAPLAAWGAFARLHLLGARGTEGLLLRPSTFAALHFPRGDGYALGWGAGQREGLGRVLTHAGSNTMWYAVVLIAPDLGLAALATTNCATEGAARACHEAVDALIDLARR